MSIFKNPFKLFTNKQPIHPITPKPDILNTQSTFQNSWLSIKNALSSPSQRHQQLSSTSIKPSLDLLWQSLALETSNNNSNHSSPCLEYFFSNDLPAKLVALALPDQPEGVKGLVINFFLSLVIMDEQLVVHPKVHKPLVRLLRSCVEPGLDSDEPDDGGWRTKEGVYEEPVVELMCHLCSRIKSHPQLLLVFLQNRYNPQHPQPAPWPPSVQPPPATPSDPNPGPFVPSTQPSQRKSVHFSPVPRPSSSTRSSLDAIVTPLDHSTRPLRSSSLSSSHSFSSDGLARSSIPPPDPSALGLSADSDMLIFSYLLRFLHREGRTGDLARAGLLFLMELAMGRSPSLHPSQHSKQAAAPDHPDPIAIAFGEWVLDSDFADVLGASLGAAYGLLPSKLVITPRDSAGEDANGGMVLGGMGTHLAGSSSMDEHTAEEIAREERRQRLLLGLGVSRSDDFRAQMDLFLKLVEFAQDVMRNTSPSSLEQYNAPPSEAPPAVCPPPHSLSSSSDPSSLGLTQEEASSDAGLGPSPAEIVASAVSSAVLVSIRKLFLNAIIYPSLLECSEHDGSAVAVMSYLEAVLSLLETDGELADNVLRFLMAEDEDGLELGDMNAGDQSRSTSGAIMQLSSPAETKAARRKSGAMQIIQDEFQKAKPERQTGVAYFTSLGRFTLKDLLVTHVQSTDSPTASAALKLLHVILVRHDRYALALLDICPDPTATAFPFPQLEVIGPADVLPSQDGQGDEYSAGQQEGEDEEEFRYPVRDEQGEEEEEEEFTYPTPAKPTHDGQSSSTAEARSDMRTPVGTHRKTPISAQAERLLCSPCPTYRTHQDGLDYLSSLIGLIDPASTVMKADSGPGALSTAFGHYLLDAEVELTSTATFRRGLLFDYVGASVVESRELGSGSNEYGGGRTGQKEVVDMDLVDHPVIRHRLAASSALVGSLLEALASFFVQPPELNLVLTGCIATLASCPTRALDGWLLPETYMAEEETFEVPVGARKVDVDEGDDRSVDEYACRMPRCAQVSEARPPGAPGGGGSVVEVYQQLAEQVGAYRRTVPGFERFLQERRQGLVFVENLEDALDTPGPGVVAAAEQAGRSGSGEKREGGMEGQAKAKESFFGALFKTTTTTTGAKSTGVPRVEQVRTASLREENLGPVMTPERASAFRPFSDHYRQTSAIRVGIEAVRTPRSKEKLKRSSGGSRRRREMTESEWDVFEGGSIDTPTRQTGPLKSSCSSSSDDDDDHDHDDEDEEEKEEMMMKMQKDDDDDDKKKKKEISLSMVLDNVVVLEEAIKELGAIVCARKSLGIDLVRLV